MVPAQQRFQALQPTAAQTELGLIEDLKLILHQRTAQIVFDEQLVVGLGMQGFGKHLYLILAVGLGLVQGLAGVFHQCLWITAMQRRAGQAEGGADADQLLVDEQGFVEYAQHLMRQQLALFQVHVVE